MVRYVPDPTGRFMERPFWSEAELDRECEGIITSFLQRQHGRVEYPVETGDLTILIEEEVEDLDQYADLSEYGFDVEGVTIFETGRKPKVRIAAGLAEDDRRQNRLRTTLTHEYGHVRFHGCLFQANQRQANLFDLAPTKPQVVSCKRDRMIDAPKIDWMEWQAGHASGAILMPISAVRRTLESIHERLGTIEPVRAMSSAGQEMIRTVVESYGVSRDAARVRLSRLGYLGTPSGSSPLFTTR
jgi:Zn-dependent peptidase ImmA (M78 family)